MKRRLVQALRWCLRKLGEEDGSRLAALHLYRTPSGGSRADIERAVRAASPAHLDLYFAWSNPKAGATRTRAVAEELTVVWQ